MAQLMQLLESNGAFTSDLMQKFLSSAQLSRDSTGSLSTRPVQSSDFVSPDVNLNLSQSTLATRTFGSQDFVSTTQNVNENLARPRIDNLNTITPTTPTTPSTPSNLNELNKTNLTPPTSRASSNINDNGRTKVEATTDITDSLNGNTHSESPKPAVTTTQSKGEPTGARPLTPDTNANNSVDTAQILSEVHETPTSSRQMLLDQVTSAVVDAHMNTTINTYANVATANERIQKERSEMSDMSSLSINGSNLWQLFMGAMVPEMTKVISFCTKVPGFPEVHQEDKLCLIKQGCFQVMVARFCVLIDHLKEEMLDPTLKVKAPRSAVKEMPMGPFLDQFFTVANQFNPLGLTDAEISMFTAVLMVCPDREGLKNAAAVKVLQQLYIQALYLQLKQSHEDADQTLTALMNMVPVFRKINEDHLKFIKMIKMKSPADYEKKFPALHKELFDTC
jgi:hypothetical protein